MPTVVTNTNISEILSGDKPVMIDFWATWCGPCRVVAPIIEKMAQKYGDRIVVGKCDVEENEDLTLQYNIRNIPTILFFKDGQVHDKLVGAQKESVVEEKFLKFL